MRGIKPFAGSIVTGVTRQVSLKPASFFCSLSGQAFVKGFKEHARHTWIMFYMNYIECVSYAWLSISVALDIAFCRCQWWMFHWRIDVFINSEMQFITSLQTWFWNSVKYEQKDWFKPTNSSCELAWFSRVANSRLKNAFLFLKNDPYHNDGANLIKSGYLKKLEQKKSKYAFKTNSEIIHLTG